MTPDIQITAAVVGAQQAGQQLDQLSAKTTKASAAAEKHAKATQKQANEMRRAVAAGAVTGGGGRVGGMISGAIGLGSMGGMGVIGAGLGAGLAVIGTTMMALSMALESSIGALKAEADARLKVGKAVTEGEKTKAGGALAWGDAAGNTRRASIALRGSMRVAETDALAKQTGLSGLHEGTLALSKMGQATPENIQTMVAAAQTGLVTASEAAAKILDGARTAAEVLSEATGQNISNDRLRLMLANVNGSQFTQQQDAIAKVRAGTADTQRVRFEGGLGLQAAQADARAAKDPTAVALRELVDAAAQQSEYLEGIYDRMSPLKAFADSLINRGNSIANQANRAAREFIAADAAAAGAGF